MKFPVVTLRTADNAPEAQAVTGGGGSWINRDELMALLADKRRLDMAENRGLTMDIVEIVAGNIERYPVALNRENLDLLL